MTEGTSDDEGFPAGERDPHPVVALPRPALPGAMISAMAAVLAIALFFVLDGRRRNIVRPARTEMLATSGFQTPPPLVIPPEPPQQPLAPEWEPPRAPAEQLSAPPPERSSFIPPQPQPPVSPMPMQAQLPLPAQNSPSAPADNPALVYDEGATSPAAQRARTTASPLTGNATPAGEEAPVKAAAITNRSMIMATGTIISAVLETPIDSARPGLIRAVVAEDARGFDGKRVLVPRGSRLIGEYLSDVRAGQKRVLVNWTRLIRSDGTTMRIGSPAADAMGGAGIPGKVNNFFFQRFAGAVLQSALAVGVNLASRSGNSSVIIGLPGNAAGTIGQDLIPKDDLRPKITVKQGTSVNVFVAHDLDFSDAPAVRDARGR